MPKELLNGFSATQTRLGKRMDPLATLLPHAVPLLFQRNINSRCLSLIKDPAYTLGIMLHIFVVLVVLVVVTEPG